MPDDERENIIAFFQEHPTPIDVEELKKHCRRHFTEQLYDALDDEN